MYCKARGVGVRVVEREGSYLRNEIGFERFQYRIVTGEVRRSAVDVRCYSR